MCEILLTNKSRNLSFNKLDFPSTEVDKGKQQIEMYFFRLFSSPFLMYSGLPYAIIGLNGHSMDSLCVNIFVFPTIRDFLLNCMKKRKIMLMDEKRN